MKVCVYGAGAIGGYLAVELALSGLDVCVIARGAHLRAIQENGLTCATLDRITGEPGLRSVCVTVMKECRSVARALQIDIAESMIERRLDVAGSAAGHKMSMLQDLERGRSLELDALVRAVQEIGRLTATPTPTLDTLLALAQERGRQAGLY
jgi:2-dehydropantoate 2-reductase